MVQMPTLEEFAALKQALADAKRQGESLVGELRVTRTERDLALERLRALQRNLFAAKSEARGTDQKDMFLNEAQALAAATQSLPAETDEEDATPVAVELGSDLNPLVAVVGVQLQRSSAPRWATQYR